MLEQLRFVQRAVARKDIVPGLTHFKIQGGRVTGHNGTVTISAPVDIPFDCAPQAAAFIKALNACDETVSLKLDGTKLTVRSGPFKALVPCVELDTVPNSYPEGLIYQPSESILTALTTLRPFIGIDASRPWACGVQLRGQSAFATNNIILCEFWLGVDVPAVNIPSDAVDEVLRIKEEMAALQISPNSITFHYPDGRWVKSQLLAIGGANMEQILLEACSNANAWPVPEGLVDALEKLSRFNQKNEERVYFRGNDISTSKRGLTDGGASIEIPYLPDKVCFHTKMILSALSVAQTVDFCKFPKPVPFFGERVRGVIVGILVDYEQD